MAFLGPVASGVKAQAEVTANWTGGAGTNSYADPDNWDTLLVPANDATNLYNVVIPGGQGVLYDVDGIHEVTDLTLGTDATLTIAPGEQLEVLDDARISGVISTAGGTFSAPGPGAQLLNNRGRLFASASGQISLGALDYSATFADRRANVTLLSVDGDGSLIDLSSALSFTSASYGAYATYFFDVVADNHGVIDVSSVGSITGAGDNDWLRLFIESEGDIVLTGLTAVSGRTQFIVDVASYDLPALQTAVNTNFTVRAGRTLNLPALVSVSGGGSGISVQDTATVNAGELLSISSAAVSIGSGATLHAPKLEAFTNSTITLGPDQTFNHGAITSIDYSEIHLHDGVAWVLDDVQSYTNTLSDHRSSVTLLLVEGQDSLLDLSSARSVTSASYGYYSTNNYDIIARDHGVIDFSSVDSITGAGDDDRVRLFIESEGDIRLPLLTTVSGRTQFVVDVDNYSLPLLDTANNTYFTVRSGRTLELPALTSMSGGGSGIAVADGATLNAPNLSAISASGGPISVGAAASLNAGALLSINGAALSISAGGELNAPLLEAFTDSSITLRPDQTFNHGTITDVNYSEIHLRDGATWVLDDVQSYVNTLSDYRNSLTLLSVEGQGSLLDLSAVSSVTSASFGYYSTNNYDIIARDHGVIDFSSVDSLTGAGDNDRVRLFIEAEGDIRLPLLTTVSGRTQFVVDVDQYSLPSLQTVADTYFTIRPGRILNVPELVSMSGGGCGIDVQDGATFNASRLTSIEAAGGPVSVGNAALLQADELVSIGSATVSIAPGGTLNAPNLVALTDCTITLEPNETFNHGVITDVTQSELRVRDGVTWSLDAVETYRYAINDYRVSATVLSADGPGSLLDLSAVQSVTMASYGSYATYYYDVVASNGGKVDLSGAASVAGAGQDDWVRFLIDSGGEIDLSSVRSLTGRVQLSVGADGILTLGDVAVTETTQLYVNHPGADVNVHGSLYLSGSSSLVMAEGAAMAIEGALYYAYTDPSRLATDTAIFEFNGSGIQFLEVGGEDLGVDGSTAGNFGIGRLVVGQEGQPTSVMPLDLFDNGNRTGGAHEALYLYGVGGLDGLELVDGSTLVLNNVNVYAMVEGSMVHLNSLISPGAMAAPFSHGTIMVPEPSSLVLLGTLAMAALWLLWRRRRA
ncbi:MAG: PEP-CTERM sorting domain-containing protein [Pirellulales bacterium]|nr:PEP-CTERM sorting domain-containing protein [Pirellulales bacterium]